MYKTLSSKIQISRWRHCRDYEKTSRSLNEHQAILHALLEGDADQAVLCLRKHLGTVREDLIIEDLLEQTGEYVRSKITVQELVKSMQANHLHAVAGDCVAELEQLCQMLAIDYKIL
jgi:hypothetical protein